MAGREVLLKSVAQAIPSYCMGAFLIPHSLYDELQRMMNSFWWGQKGQPSKGIRWMSWDKLTMRKDDGGLGFRDLHAFNPALLGKQGWHFMTNPTSLVSRVFKAKYFPDGDFLGASVGHSPSFAWRSVWSSQRLLREGVRWIYHQCLA